MDLQRAARDCMVTTAELAARADFRLGNLVVSPPTRTVKGPVASVDVEPRVMQVLVVLADAAGQVVTRETLFNRCWGSAYVGDDSLNRAVAAARRAIAEADGKGVEIETIPRTGYRLTGAAPSDSGDPAGADAAAPTFSRRLLLGGGIAAAAGVGTGIWWIGRSRNDARFDALMRQGSEALADTGEFDPPKARGFLEQAVRIRPDSARAWGLLACARMLIASGAPPTESAVAVKAAEDAARRALALDPREPNALLAMFELQGSTLDWMTRDRKLRQILSIDPKNVLAISEFVLMLQAAGLSRESWNWNERGLALEPLSPDFLGKRALKLWIAGRVSQADKVIDQLRDLYPTEPWTWWVRFLIYALTDRARAAQAMIESNPEMLGTGPDASFWPACLDALDSRSTAGIAKARAACATAARLSGDLAGQAVMVLSALNEVDAAFDVANGFLLSRGSIVRRGPPGSKPASDAMYRVNTQWLFTPPCAAMRADPRFLELCDGIGLTEYWRARHVRPDYQLQR